MSQIDRPGSLSYNVRPDTTDASPSENVPRQIFPNAYPIQSEQQEIRAASLLETMESMSLVMGTRLRQNAGRKSPESDRSSQLQETLMRWVPKVEGQRLVEMAARFPMLGAGEGDPIAQMQQDGVPDGAMVLLLSSLLGDPRLGHKRRRRLEDALATLLEDESISIDALAWLSLGDVNKKDLLPLRQIYQRTSRDNEENPQGMAAWFSEIQRWPDRRARLRVLIRALALDLKRNEDYPPARIVSAIGELKRLLLFFSMEDHCTSVASSVEISSEQMLGEVLLLLEQSWIYPDWIASRMHMMNLTGGNAFIWIRRMLELLRFIPLPCFQDDEQCDQLIDAFTQLQEQLEKQEME